MAEGSKGEVGELSEIEDAYLADFGVLNSGDTALIEANDAWALGLYGRSLGPKEYLGLLGARWLQLSASPEPTRSRKLR